jgi:hypothetical protein
VFSDWRKVLIRVWVATLAVLVVFAVGIEWRLTHSSKQSGLKNPVSAAFESGKEAGAQIRRDMPSLTEGNYSKDHQSSPLGWYGVLTPAYYQCLGDARSAIRDWKNNHDQYIAYLNGCYGFLGYGYKNF